jgi:alkane 1-monooxygenase
MRLSKRLGFLSAFILPALLVGGHALGGAWHWSAFLFAYALVPLLDALAGRDRHNPTEAEAEALWESPYFEGLLYLWAWLQVGLLFWAAREFALGHFSWHEGVAFTCSFMTIGSNGINIAHELGHKSGRMAQWHSHLLLLLTCYMHFFIEHNRGHHVHVGTPQDPATSRRGQSFYGFWRQSVVGGWQSAWRIEAKRLERAGLPLWSRHNAMLAYALMPLLLALLLLACGHAWAGAWVPAIPAFFFAQAFLAFSSLEAVNYIEHYGMSRRQLPDGRFERVTHLHSWNSSHSISNFLLFHLQRHSDHHAHAARPYQVLRHFDASPQLPAGYPTMILMALLPPLWFGVMDARLDRWESERQAAGLGQPA